MRLITQMFKRPGRVKDEFWNRMEIHKALKKNGVISERAKMEHRSLSYEERNIIHAVRSIAISNGFSRLIINATEMEGERDKELVFEPYRIRVKFAYYQSPYYGHPDADASFIVVESNHPVLIQHGNFGKEELEKYHVKIPKHPTFDKWVENGRKCYRGE